MKSKRIAIFDLTDSAAGHYPILQSQVDKIVSFFGSYQFLLLRGKNSRTTFETLKPISIFLSERNVRSIFLRQFSTRLFNFFIHLFNTLISVCEILIQKTSGVVFLSYEEIFIPLLLLAGRKTKKICFFVHYLPSNTSLLARIRRKTLIFCLKRADLLIVREDYVKIYLNLETNVPKNKIAILPNIPKSTKKIDVLNPRGIEKKGIIGFIGIIRVDKGIFLLLEALKSMNFAKKQTKNIVKISGYPRYQNISERILRFSHLLPNLIINLKSLNKEDYLMELLSVDIVILPYKKQFGEGRESGQLFDAIFCEKPVIAPNFGIFSYYIKKYGIGWLFDADDTSSLTDLLINLDDNYERYYAVAKRNVINTRNKLLNEWKYRNIYCQFKEFFS